MSLRPGLISFVVVNEIALSLSYSVSVRTANIHSYLFFVERLQCFM
jgi:hypothetical protein